MPVDKRKVNILLVDDDQGDIRALQRAFAKGNLRCALKVVTNPEEALLMLTGHDVQAFRPDVLILDLNMPRMSGLELLQELHQRNSAPTFVTFVLSTSGRERERVEAYSFGVAGYVRKAKAGAGFSDFAELVQRYLQVVDLPSAPNDA